MQDCASGQCPQYDPSSHVNAQLTMMQSAESMFIFALHTEWYNNIPQDLATRLRRPLLFQVPTLLLLFIKSLSYVATKLAGGCTSLECPTLSHHAMIHAMQDKAAGGLLVVNLDKLIRDTISESLFWEQMRLPVPESVMELTPIKHTLWRLMVKASAVARCYNKVCAFCSTSNKDVWCAIYSMLTVKHTEDVSLYSSSEGCHMGEDCAFSHVFFCLYLELRRH